MKFITRKHLPRRTFLRSAGITIGLPLLDAMVPALTPLAQAQALTVPKRFVGVWHPQGAAPGYWSPVQAGADFEFSYITKPLEKLRDRIVLITGLDVPEAFPRKKSQAATMHAARYSCLAPAPGVTLSARI